MERNCGPTAHLTRSQDLQLAEQARNPESFTRGWAVGSRSVGVISNNEENRLRGRDENTHERKEQLMDVIEQARADWD